MNTLHASNSGSLLPTLRPNPWASTNCSCNCRPVSLPHKTGAFRSPCLPTAQPPPCQTVLPLRQPQLLPCTAP
eukprot:2597326-Lingulodinium_polyedra.AAC.1